MIEDLTTPPSSSMISAPLDPKLAAAQKKFKELAAATRKSKSAQQEFAELFGTPKNRKARRAQMVKRKKAGFL